MNPKRIILDCRAWHSRPGGVGSYTRALVERLPKALPEVEFLLLRHPQGPANLSSAPNVQVATMPGMPHGPLTLFLKPRISTRPGDLYHALFPVIPLGLKIPVIVTSHELMWFHTPHLVSEGAWNRWLERWYHRVFVSYAYRRADRILANSHCTKDDILALWPEMEDKIRVTPFAPAPVFTNGKVQPDPSRLESFVPKGARYLLVVGNGSRNKNHEVAVRAFARACPSREDVHLVVVQRSRLGLPRFRQVVEESGLAERIHLHGAIDGPDVLTLMKWADGFVFPSHYEGFGLPILEAMAMKCPVLCSNAGSLPEVAGNAALLYHPDDVDGFAEGMKKILDDHAVRQKLVDFGNERVRYFTWERCVQNTIAAYRELVDSSIGS